MRSKRRAESGWTKHRRHCFARAIGGNVAGEEISDPSFHPVWARVEAAGCARVQSSARRRGAEAARSQVQRQRVPQKRDRQSARDHSRPLAFLRARSIASRASRSLRPMLEAFCPPMPAVGCPARPDLWDEAYQVMPLRILQRDVLRHDGVPVRRPAPSGCRGWRQPTHGGDRLSLSVDDNGHRSHPLDPGLERCRQDCDPRWHGHPTARHRGVGPIRREYSGLGGRDC